MATINWKAKATTDLEKELADLLTWYPWYSSQCEQYVRCQALGEVFDKDIMAIHAEAKQKQLRIREIRALLQG